MNKVKFKKDTSPKTFIGTFNFGNKLLMNEKAKPVHNYWIKITAIDKIKAQEIMMLYFGANWSIVYSEDAFTESIQAHFTDGELAHVTEEIAPEFKYSVVNEYS